MKKFALLLLAVQLVVGEPQEAVRIAEEPSDSSNVIDQRLLNRIADILSNDGDGSKDSEGKQEYEGDGIVNSEILQRIARIISQNEAQTQHHSNGQSIEGRTLATEYGLPEDVKSKLVSLGDFELGMPIPARRIASFHLQNENYPEQRRNEDNSGGRFYFISRPELVERIASFKIPDPEVIQIGGDENDEKQRNLLPRTQASA